MVEPVETTARANRAPSVAEGSRVMVGYTMATHELTVEVPAPPLPGTGQQCAHWVRSGLVLVPASLGAGETWTLWSAPEGGLAVVDRAVHAPPGATSYRLVPAPGVPDNVAADFRGLAGLTPLHVVDDSAAGGPASRGPAAGWRRR